MTIKPNKQNFKSLRWFLLLAIVVISLNPLHSQVQAQAQTATGLGAGVLRITKNHVDYEVISFDRLFFKYQPPFDVEHPDGTVTKGNGKHMAIPPAIRALNGKKIVIKGFVLPLESNGDTVKSFLLADELVTCLFCAMLGYDQWMSGKVLDSKGFSIRDEQYDDPITIYGTLEVGEEYEDKQLVSLYRIKADAFEGKRQKFLGIF